jgi:hypothetical protein
VLGEDDLQNRVSQELKTLVIEMMALSLVPETGMRERLREQQGIPELVTNALFQGTHGYWQIERIFI